MTTEQKAEAYDKALERAKKLQETCDSTAVVGWCEYLFPELKESEDEKIRRCIGMCLTDADEQRFKDFNTNLRNCLNWLEKQGEKFQYWKPSEEQLEALDYAYNSCPDTERGNYYEGVLETIIDDLHKLSEKQGEQILANSAKTCKDEQKPTNNIEPKFKVGDKVCAISNRFECTIESIDESTYYGDTTNFDIKDQDKWKLIEQKPTERAEPKFKVGDTMRTLQEVTNGYTDGMPVVVSIDEKYYHCTNELIAIKDQEDYEFPPINVKQKPTDKVEPKFKVGDWITHNTANFIFKIINVGSNGYEVVNRENYKKTISFDNEDNYHLWAIPKSRIVSSTWGEEDEKMRNNLIRLLIRLSANTQTNSTTPNYSYPNEIDWLKSLKQRIGWKPSKEQMQALKEACDKHWEPDGLDSLYTLYEQLKKITE